ncbi:cation:dicarboxylate symporter family transporter [Candidatus Sororendozoicomonas aggregata]|uniref:cation:dicarboxylate symporter family transporter n=1 Tax=Candidatus Sororendozoicomonas aggregata TaxID=3073239 RepID=UPI002ED42B48
MMSAVLVNALVLLVLLLLIYWIQRKNYSFSRCVFIAMAMGLAFGTLMQWFYGLGAASITKSLSYFNVIGNGYVSLLKMTIIPLIMVSIVSAILKMQAETSLGRVTTMTLGILLTTTAVAALIAIIVALVFGLDARGLLAMKANTAMSDLVVERINTLADYSIPQMLMDFIPANPFLDMTGQRATSTIAVVIFSGFLGLGGLGAIRNNPALRDPLVKGVDVVQAMVIAMVRIVLRLTPYGILALMTKMAATSHSQEIITLLKFIVANYTALILVFCVHLLLLVSAGIKPGTYISSVGPVLAFAFSSRSSAGTIPMNVQAQTTHFKVPEGIANFTASIGATIGQNGCAGVYPAILAVMVAPIVGIDPMSPGFIVTLLLVITFSSFGVAGVGGGATFAALMVLSAMNLPVAVVGLLIAVEPLIDMGRTALNVSGSMTTGIVTSRILKQTGEKSFAGATTHS